MSKYINVDDLQRYCDNQKDHSITPNEFQRMNHYDFGWHKGTPTEEGLYLIAIPFLTDGIGKKIYRYETDYFNKAGKWRMFTNEVVAFQKIEPFKED